MDILPGDSLRRIKCVLLAVDENEKQLLSLVCKASMENFAWKTKA
jgi:hypothetical protein